MLGRAVSTSWLTRAALIAPTELVAAHAVALELRGLGWRGAAAGTGEGSRGARGGASPRERAADYLKEKERQQAAAAADAGGPQPRSRLAEAAAEFAEAPQAYLLSSPSGLGVGAEAAIEQAIKDGALDNLPGRGKPLRQEDHGAQFYRVDPLVQAVTRTMGAQNVKPLSLELQEELQRELAALRARLAAELRAARAAEAAAAAGGPGSEHGDAGSNGGASGGASGSWFGRWLGGAAGRVSGSSGGSSSSNSSRQISVAALRAGQHQGLLHAAEHVRQLIRQYNSAVLADKETFGAFWPLNPAKQLDWEAEVDAALAAVTREATAGGHPPS